MLATTQKQYRYSAFSGVCSLSNLRQIKREGGRDRKGRRERSKGKGGEIEREGGRDRKGRGGEIEREGRREGMKRRLFPKREASSPQPSVPYFLGLLLGEIEVRSKVIKKNGHVAGVSERQERYDVHQAFSHTQVGLLPR